MGLSTSEQHLVQVKRRFGCEALMDIDVKKDYETNLKKLSALSVVVESDEENQMPNGLRYQLEERNRRGLFGKCCSSSSLNELGNFPQQPNDKAEFPRNEGQPACFPGGNFSFSPSRLKDDVGLKIENMFESISTSPEASSSSFSFSGSGVVLPHQSDDSDSESTLDSYSSFLSHSHFGKKKSLSVHYFGKAKSFTSLKDAENIESIQELAKPKRFKKTGMKQNKESLHSVKRPMSKSAQKKGTLAKALALKTLAERESDIFCLESKPCPDMETSGFCFCKSRSC